MKQKLTTARLRLRPIRRSDAQPVQALCNNWNVARMLSRVPYPNPLEAVETWIRAQAEARERGLSYTFAIEHQGGEHQGGEHKAGEHKAGEHRDGEHQGGEHKVGEQKAGEHKVGEHRDGEHRDGLIGVVGVSRRGAGNPGGGPGGCHEIGYWLGEPWWGQGLMTEAVSRVIDFTRAELGLDRLLSDYFADNPASGRVQEKCGFRITGRGRLKSQSRGCAVDAVFTELVLLDVQLAAEAAS